MIHQLLRLTRHLFVIDVETTGLDPKADRIIEIGFQQWTSEGLKKEWRSLVNPGVPIPEAVTKVHGITDVMVKACRGCPADKEHIAQVADGHEFAPWPSFKQLAPNLAKGFTDCDFAGKNVRFDLRFLAAEFDRAGVAWSYTGARIVDADKLEQLGEPRHLSNLYEKHLGKKMENAHQALSDVRATTEVIEAQLTKYQSLPRDLDQLHAAQWPGWVDGDGKFKLINGVVCCNFGKWARTPLKDIPASYLEWILRGDFSEDVKRLVREVL